MASHALKIMRKAAIVTPKFQKIPIMSCRSRVTTETGAFLPQPEKTQFGLLRVLFTVVPGLWLGATISKEGAAFLEENDIFVPSEDDDED